jgi:uncharacterized protein
MKVVLDTNVVLISLPKISKYRPILDGVLNSEYELIITNEILTEYFEIIQSKTNRAIAENFSEMILKLDNVTKIDVHFKWNLITEDVDDNKFVDCAIASGAMFLVSNDRHYDVIKDIKFPPLNIINANQFLDSLLVR